MRIGLVPERLDLRNYFESPVSLQTAIDDLDALWVVGGNAFLLRRAMRQSGFDGVLRKRSIDPLFVYGGYSAGSCVMGPTLRGIQLADDPVISPPRYWPEPIWDGLAFVPFAIAPHYRSPHPESGMTEESIDFFVREKIPFIALRDGEVHLASYISAAG